VVFWSTVHQRLRTPRWGVFHPAQFNG
jgi:hypothetical protein